LTLLHHFLTLLQKEPGVDGSKAPPRLLGVRFTSAFFCSFQSLLLQQQHVMKVCFLKELKQKSLKQPFNYSKSILEVYSCSAIEFVGAEDLHPFTASESGRKTQKQFKIQMKG
jgi:hypothetical protein